MKDIDESNAPGNPFRDATVPLVRITQPPHLAGVVTCLDHLAQLQDLAQRRTRLHDDQECPAFLNVEIPSEIVLLHAHRCLMCGVRPSPNRHCENDSCARELHPQWPAVYCCNDCALEDL